MNDYKIILLGLVQDLPEDRIATLKVISRYLHRVSMKGLSFAFFVTASLDRNVEQLVRK